MSATQLDAGAGSGAVSGAAVGLAGVSKRFGSGKAGGLLALDTVDFALRPGEFVSIVGPSGCGKSTLLRIMAGLVAPSTGRCTRPEGVATAFVFQEAALLPWRTAQDNVKLPLEVVGYPAAERDARCLDLLRSVGLEKFRHAYPNELSGGMKQRVAIVRALSWNPPILLMDEPFSALDELTKNQLQDDLLGIWGRERKTILFVTHNISEAVYLADRVVVMSAHPGRIKTVIDVKLPRARTPEVRETLEFIAHVRAARKALQASEPRA